MTTSFRLFHFCWLGLLFGLVNAHASAPNRALVAEVDRTVYCIISTWTDDGETRVFHGTGVQLAPGLVATVAHQVDGMDSIEVYRGDYRISEADLIAIDRTNDLAVLRIAERPGGLPLESDTPITQGQAIFQIGCPFGLFHAVSQGIVQKPQTRVDGRQLIAMDMTIHTGDSGGPVFDMQGHWVGVIRGFLTDTPHISIAMPIELLKALIRDTGIAISP